MERTTSKYLYYTPFSDTLDSNENTPLLCGVELVEVGMLLPAAREVVMVAMGLLVVDEPEGVRTAPVGLNILW